MRGIVAHLTLALAAAGVAVAVAVLALGAARAGALHEVLATTSPWLALVSAPAGFALLAWITRRAFPGAQGGGVPQTLAMYAAPDDRARPLLSLRIAVGKVFLTIAGFASGASIGREGPGIQIGASIVHATRRFGVAPRTLILAGAGAGVAATFGAPAAGVVFAFEQVARRIEWRALPAVLIAVPVATFASRTLLGGEPYFGHALLTIGAADWKAVIACGLGGGVLGALFNRGLVDTQTRLRPLLQSRPYACAAALGLLVGVLNLALAPAMQGSGYDATLPLLRGAALADSATPFLKLLATLLSSLAAIPGGLFSPSLAVGTSFGALLAPLLGGGAAPAILGLAAYLAGATQGPLTATVIVMELLGAPQLALPLLATSFIAFGASRLIARESVYEGLCRNL